MGEARVQLGTRIAEDLDARLHRFADRTGEPIAEIVSKALERYLDARESDLPKIAKGRRRA
jgi:predicted transcriptional regulator